MSGMLQCADFSHFRRTSGCPCRSCRTSWGRSPWVQPRSKRRLHKPNGHLKHDLQGLALLHFMWAKAIVHFHSPWQGEDAAPQEATCARRGRSEAPAKRAQHPAQGLAMHVEDACALATGSSALVAMPESSLPVQSLWPCFGSAIPCSLCRRPVSSARPC